MTLRGAHSRQVESQKTSILGSVYVCTFIEVFVYVFSLSLFFRIRGDTEAQNNTIRCLFFVFSCYTGTNVLSKTHFSFFHGSTSKSRLTFARKFGKLRRNSNRKPRDAKNKQTNLGWREPPRVSLQTVKKPKQKQSNSSRCHSCKSRKAKLVVSKKEKKQKEKKQKFRKNKTQKDQSNPLSVI